VLMLVHINQPEAAERVHNAWLRTIEDGIHTYDIFAEGVSTEKVGTKEFACAVSARMGQKPNTLKPVTYAASKPHAAPAAVAPTTAEMQIKGLDVFVLWPSRKTADLADAVGKLAGDGIKLQMIDNRGVKVWPAGLAAAETFCTDSFRCRFMSENGAKMGQLIDLQRRIADAGIEIAMTETLRSFDGQAGFSLAQGQ
jgi:isocitrate dehydrogenase